MQKHFHHYSLTERLASKPLRSVYLAHHVSDVSQKVVVKVFDSRCLKLEQESKNLLQKVEWIKQFTHAHIVPVLDLGIEQGQPYIVSSYQFSGSLRDRLDRLAPDRLDLQDALPIIFQVGRALRYAHQQNILHGHIKPENIFFNKLGEALLADFRLADLIDVTKLDYKSDPHSTCYMAPEQFSGTISEKSDQYGLACLAYELITGRTPFAVQGFSPMWTKQDTERAIPLSDLVPDLPEQAEEVVLKAMAKDPSERYANISIFIRALEALSLLPTSLSTSVSTSPPMVALRSDTPVRSMAEPLETLATVGPAMRLSDAPVTTRLLERSEYVNNEHNTSKTLDTPPSKTLHKRSSKTLHKRSSKILHTPSAKTSDSPSSKILDISPSKTSDSPSSKILDISPSKISDSLSSKILDISPSKISDSLSSKILDISPSKTSDSPSSKILDISPSKTSDSPSSKILDISPSKTSDSPSSKILDISPSKTSDSPSSKILDISPSKISDSLSSKILDISPSKTSDSPSSKILDISPSKTSDSPSSKILDISPSKTSDSPSSKILDISPSKTSDSPSSKILDISPSKTSDSPSSKILDISPSKTSDSPSSKILDISPSKALATLTEEAHVESLTKGGLPQSRKPLTPTLWVAFALSGLIILLGAILPYLLVPLHSPSSSNAGKNSPKPPITNPSTRITPTTVPIQSQLPSSTLIQTHLTSSYAEQTSNVYNLTNEGTLDWIQWGLNAPEDVNHKLAVQQQISNFTLIGNGVLQRDNHYANAYTWSDGTPVMVAPPQQPSGVYVRGIGNGFTFAVVASTTPRTLRVYLGAVHAEGHFWAGINGRTITDTTLDMRNNPNIADNGIYTVTFSSSVPDQLVIVKFTVRASDASNGYVMLEAATLED